MRVFMNVRFERVGECAIVSLAAMVCVCVCK